MDQLIRAGDFVVDDRLERTFYNGFIQIAGKIGCKGNIVITVTKTIEVLSGDPEQMGEAMVQTVTYAYNAHIAGADTFLRYDNAHAHPGHQDKHHKHEVPFALIGQHGGMTTTWVGPDGWPTLGEFIQEVRDWYYANRQNMSDPEAIPDDNAMVAFPRSLPAT